MASHSSSFRIEQGSARGESQAPRVRVIGEMDVLAGAELRDVVRGHLEAGRQITLDLTDVTFMDSSGIAAVLLSARSPEERARVSIVPSIHRQPARLAELTGLTQMFGSGRLGVEPEPV